MMGKYGRVIHTVDSHTEGNPTRVVVGGVKVPPGKGLLEKSTWLEGNDDGLRRLLNFEPRGSGMMCSVLLLPAERSNSDFSLIIMEQDEYVPMCGHCLIGVATTVVATGMVPMARPVTSVIFDTPAGQVACDVNIVDDEVSSVSFNNVESFLLYENKEIMVEGVGKVLTDIAYGGDFYAFVDADGIGLELSPTKDSELISVGGRVSRAVAQQVPVRHPERPEISRCYQVLFTSRKATAGNVKQAVVCPPGSIDRSPCGTGTSARIAIMHSRGELALGQSCKFEGVLGTVFEGEAVSAKRRNDILYVVPRVTGRAYITGFHQFILEPKDPLPRGFRIGARPRDH